jgi:hypothetical protein
MGSLKAYNTWNNVWKTGNEQVLRFDRKSLNKGFHNSKHGRQSAMPPGLLPKGVTAVPADRPIRRDSSA